MYPKVISPRPISTSARGYTHLFIRKCKHLRAHTTGCGHKLCVSTCAQCFIRDSANQAAFRQDENWSAGGDVGYTPRLGLTGAICTSFKVIRAGFQSHRQRDLCSFFFFFFFFASREKTREQRDTPDYFQLTKKNLMEISVKFSLRESVSVFLNVRLNRGAGDCNISALADKIHTGLSDFPR